MSIKKLSFMLLSTLSLAALLNGCGSSSKEGSIGGVATVEESKCRVCHAASIDPISKTNIVQDFIGTSTANQSVHYQLPDGKDGIGCQGCHGGGAQHNGVGPIPFRSPLIEGRCNAAECHNGKVPAGFTSTNYVVDCASCHNGTGIHSIQYGLSPALLAKYPALTAADAYNNCVACHAVGQAKHGDGVNDNDGVRAVTDEFSKWSHHVTGVSLQNAHCAACHLEGKAEGSKIVVDRKYHMADNKTHLRNVDTDADMQWDPAAPSHSTMDSFCMGCHDADGATSTKSAAIRALMVPAAGKTASATNPFGDTISNQYDMMERPAVVDAKGQFATGNNSHHAVLGKKYTGRTRAAGSRQVANAASFASNSSAAMPGPRRTIYDAGKFNATYVTLADAAGETDVAQSLSGRNGGTSLGDDSTLHCGDCHTVGQFRKADVSTAAGSFNRAVIGAHGSANEYMLRNNAGTDARHRGVESATLNSGIAQQDGTKPYLVCYNCHDINTYGYPGGSTGNNAGNHAGEYAYRDRCNSSFTTTGGGNPLAGVPTNPAYASAVFANMTGEGRLRTIIATTGANLGKAYSPTSAFFGNIYGIQCANCHNSGVKGNIFGGIHGSKTQTYTDGMGNTTKHNRFMPGLGNVMFVPGVKGGFTGGSLATYKAYSGNRNGKASFNNLSTSLGQTYTLLPVRTIKYTGENANGSYQYVTGGVSNDLNWEQVTQQSIAGQTDLQSKAMGCYTITPNPTAPVAGANAEWIAAVPGGSNFQSALRTLGAASTITAAAIARPAGEQGAPKVAFLASQGYPADDIRYPAAYQITAGDGREVFDIWGGCDDHNGAQGAGTSIYRKVNRKVSY